MLLERISKKGLEIPSVKEPFELEKGIGPTINWP